VSTSSPVDGLPCKAELACSSNVPIKALLADFTGNPWENTMADIRAMVETFSRVYVPAK
jgi:hypothetical protein